MNIETEGDVTRITPLRSMYSDVSDESKERCIRELKFNVSINRQLYNNCRRSNCTICDNSVSKCVPNGSCEASTMIVDAFPSEYETFAGAFTDEKGVLVRNITKDRTDIYYTTVIKCHNIQDTNEEIINNCLSKYFIQELKIIRPRNLILTYSAFQACLKYKIIPSVGAINYFTRTRVMLYDYEVDMYVVYDPANLTSEQRVAFSQGLECVLR